MSQRERQAGKGKTQRAGFNRPFAGLKASLKSEPPAPARPPPPPPRPAPSGPSDDELFHIAMFGVERMPDSHGIAPPPAPREATPVDEDAETLARLAELVSGAGELDISSTDEYIEGSLPGLDKRVLLALRRGDYATQGHVDLHGLTKVEAKEEVTRFLTQAQREGKRCVLIVHGRGLNSKDQIPVLKEQLQVWLKRGRIGRLVLAFATARPCDGGAGAVYVLLRR